MTSRTAAPPAAPLEMKPTIALLTIDSPLGRIALRGDDVAVRGLEISRGGILSTDGLDDTPSPPLERAAEQLAEYFTGHRRSFDVSVDFAGTPFQRHVWAQLADIPFGQVRRYGQIGAAIGNPTASRAVGGAIGANPVPILIPCHRVLASDGRITGYSAGDGVSTKAWLLDLEGIAHR